MQIYNRADIVNFMEMSEKFKRMQGFTDGSKSSNITTYNRRYIDEKIQRSDPTGTATSIAYAFDRIVDNDIHEKLATIQDDEILTEKVKILSVDFNKKVGNAYEARLRTFSVIPDTDGDGTDAYTYSGTFNAASEIQKGTATVTADGMEATFTASTVQPASLEENSAPENSTSESSAKTLASKTTNKNDDIL